MQIPKPAVVIYKTKADYTHFVPVQLDENKMKVISFPAPQDLKNGNAFREPVSLKDGYYLDRKGVNLKTAFVKMTYQEYAQLIKNPKAEDLYNILVDKTPFTEMYVCPDWPQTEEVEQLNQLIDDALNECQSLIEK
ncbi:MAG: hypothetical protein JXR60_07270 [Bacteroidales bacterium]|nr:hypothetical protein [Bacteroidales bacterium]